MPKLLALDLSTNVGIARLERGVVPTFETLRLEGPDLTFKIGALRAWLYAEYDRAPFDGIAWEKPLIAPTDTVLLLELLYGLVGECYGFVGFLRSVEHIHLRWCEVSVPDVKKAVAGKAKASKEEMLYAARRKFNWRVTDDHQADAGGVGIVAFDRLWPKVVT
jgi:hypothetical protein